MRRVLVGLVLVGTVVVAPLGTDGNAGTTECGPNVGLETRVRSVGQDVPVLLVHGWTGSAAQWADSESGLGLADSIRQISGVTVTAFDYGTASTKWVTSPEIGPMLARAIECLGKLSLGEGGRGKVVIVGYSMGGLAARYAVAQPRIKVDGRAGLVVTIGTPHNGAPGADLYARAKNLDLEAARAMADPAGVARDLAPLEGSNVSTFYVGGQLGVSASLNLFGVEVRVGVAIETDLGVPLDSSIPTLANPVPGTTFICENSIECTHTSILRSVAVQQAVVSGIQAWIQANPLPEPPTTTTAAPTTTIAAPPSPTEPSRPQAAVSGTDALSRLLDAWVRGDRQAAATYATAATIDYLFSFVASSASRVECFPSLSGLPTEEDCVFNLTNGRGGSAFGKTDDGAIWQVKEICIETDPGDCAI